jgi:hypothetical protein
VKWGGGLFTTGEAWCGDRSSGTDEAQGATLAGGPALELTGGGCWTLLRHLAGRFTGLIREQGARRRPDEGLQLKQQEEGGESGLHPVETVTL